MRLCQQFTAREQTLTGGDQTRGHLLGQSFAPFATNPDADTSESFDPVEPRSMHEGFVAEPIAHALWPTRRCRYDVQ